MAAGKWKTYDKAMLNRLNGELDMNATTNWKLALFLSTSNCNTLTAHDKLADLTNEHANANGYTTGGVALTSVSIARTGNVIKFTCANPVFTASGGSITARYGVIYRNATDGTIVNPLYVVCVLDTTAGGTDVTATTGNTLTVTMNASGITTDTGNNAD
jgi:hypothetical protein